MKYILTCLIQSTSNSNGITLFTGNHSFYFRFMGNGTIFEAAYISAPVFHISFHLKCMVISQHLSCVTPFHIIHILPHTNTYTYARVRTINIRCIIYHISNILEMNNSDFIFFIFGRRMSYHY